MFVCANQRLWQLLLLNSSSGDSVAEQPNLMDWWVFLFPFFFFCLATSWAQGEAVSLRQHCTSTHEPSYASADSYSHTKKRKKGKRSRDIFY